MLIVCLGLMEYFYNMPGEKSGQSICQTHNNGTHFFKFPLTIIFAKFVDQNYNRKPFVL